MAARIAKYSLFVFLYGAILLSGVYLPLIFEAHPDWQLPSPYGEYKVASRPNLSLSSWLEGDFQEGIDRYVLDDPYVRAAGIRLRNEYHYTCFKRSAHRSLIRGKDGYIFDRSYVQAGLGLDFLGEQIIEDEVEKIARLYRFLKAQGKELLVLLPPSKAAIRPDKLPEEFQFISPRSTNRSAFGQAFERNNIPYIDFIYLGALESPPTHLLYPKGGLHWSHYGVFHVADTLSKRLITLLQQPLAKPKLSQLLITDQLRSPDDELINLQNLVSAGKSDSLAYPVIHYQQDSTTVKPRVLVIADSYYRVLYDLEVHQQLFHVESRYMHYLEVEIGKESTAGSGGERDWSFNQLMDLLQNMDVVIYQASETNLYRLGFGFTEGILGGIKE